MPENDYIKSIIDSIISSENFDPQTKASMLSVLEVATDEVRKGKKIVDNPSNMLFDKNIIKSIDGLSSSPKVACQGLPGSYSHIACKQAFQEPDITFLEDFEDVTKSVSKGEYDFGILPVENSSVGPVDNIIEFICKYNCYITYCFPVKIEHCICAPKGAKKENIKTVHSHPQSIKQSSSYIKSHGFDVVKESNNAVAAKVVSNLNDVSTASICSTLCAKIYNLDILEYEIQDFKENYTRFIVFSKDALILPDANTISIAVNFANQTGALNRFLTLFSIFNLDLTQIQSLPIGGADFDIRFHLDFKGNVFHNNVKNLLGYMYDIYDDFQFLGNFMNL